MSRARGALAAQSRYDIGQFWPEMLAAAAWLAATVYVVPARLNQDIAYQLWMARQLNGGLDFYSQFPEINPPLWFWMARGVDALASLLHLPASVLMMLAVCLAIGLSTSLGAALVRAWPAWQRAALLLGLLAALMIVPLQEFEQREHLCLIGALPYALLIARRGSGQSVDWRLALAIGLLAAPFLALKHYFVLIPLLLEAWLVWQRRGLWRPLRAETLVLVGVALAYAVALLLLESDYLTKMVPLLQVAYGDFRASWEQLALNRSTIVVYLAVPYLLLVRKRLPAEAQAVLLVVLGFCIAYVIQGKGWQYQLVPIMGGLLVALVLQLVRQPAPMAVPRWQFGWAMALLGLVLAPPLLMGRYDNPYTAATGTLMAGLPKGDTAIILSTQPYIAWPMMEELGLRWPSRYGMFWMLQGVASREAAGEPLPEGLARFVDRVRLETVSDLACNPPSRIIDDTESVVGVPFDMLGWFKQEPRFAELFGAYALSQSYPRFQVYERVGAIPAGLATDCVTIY